MGKKIFVSYKYADSKVLKLNNLGETTVRNYVDLLQESLDDEDHINKGEADEEDMSSLADSTIASKLGDKIFDSTVTIVLISKGMKESGKLEKDQWIPWEISYSLKEQSRKNGNSKTNAVLAVIIPDEIGSYDYFLRYNSNCNSTTLMTTNTFDIIGSNMFNKNNPVTRECNGSTIYVGEMSYIKYVKWGEFIDDINSSINSSLEIWRERNLYTIKKKLT
jgi:hypothetical protein